MHADSFDIKVLNLHWIKDFDDATDLCAHGNVFVRIGNEIVSNENSLDVTVSSTALYLMRTLENDYKADNYGSQLLPCCGHFFTIDEESGDLDILGCNVGIDWTIIHTDNKNVKHISNNGEEAIIHKKKYKKLVLDFADEVEKFYNISLPKILPIDIHDKNGYLAFWQEWQELRYRSTL